MVEVGTPDQCSTCCSQSFDSITTRSISFEVASFHQGWKPGISSAGGVSHRIAKNTAF
jgi:hypothetical protein